LHTSTQRIANDCEKSAYLSYTLGTPHSSYLYTQFSKNVSSSTSSAVTHTHTHTHTYTYISINVCAYIYIYIYIILLELFYNIIFIIRVYAYVQNT